MGKRNQGNGIFSMQRDKLKSFMTDALSIKAEHRSVGTELAEHYKRCADNGIHTGAFKDIQKLLTKERAEALAYLEAWDNYRDVLLKDMERDLVKEAQKAKPKAEDEQLESGPITAAEVAEVVAEALTDVITAGTTAQITPEPKKKRGRPSKAEMAAKAALETGGNVTESQTADGTTVLTDDDPMGVGAAEPEGYSPDDLNMRAGAQACKAGKSHLDNPHEPGSDRHIRWQLGYQWQEDQTPAGGEAVAVPESQEAREASGMF